MLHRILIIVGGAILATFLIFLFMTFLLRENSDHSDHQPRSEPESKPIFRENFITPQELTLKARSRKNGPDPYIAAGSYTDQQAAKILQKVKSLHGKEQECFDKFIKEYQDRLFEHCQKNELGQYSPGGCEETAYKYSIHTRVLEVAMENCVKNK